MQVIVLKIGGSVLTDKNSVETLWPGELNRVAGEIAEYDGSLVLVHGAGSFGHPQAKEWIGEYDPEGMLRTHLSVSKLNGLFVEVLGDRGMRVMPVHPFGNAVLEDGRLVSFDLNAIQVMLDRGVVPVLHGDVAMDRERGAAILSGDQICVYLARHLDVDRLGLGTNVDGILVDGKSIPRVTHETFKEVEGEVSGADGVDVTGGMLGKVRELLTLASDGISSQVFNASTPGHIARFLGGEKIGTMIGGDRG